MDKQIADSMLYAAQRMHNAACPWDELQKLITECRQQNAAAGGDDLLLATALAVLTVHMHLPVKKGGQ